MRCVHMLAELYIQHGLIQPSHVKHIDLQHNGNVHILEEMEPFLRTQVIGGIFWHLR